MPYPGIVGVTAFSAKSNIFGDYGPSAEDMVIPFPNVQFTFGGGYDAVSSIFTAPVEGIYFISARAAKGSDDSLIGRSSILINGVEDRALRNGANLYETASADALFHLQAGDQIWLEVLANKQIFCDPTLCSFEGCLLYEII